MRSKHTLNKRWKRQQRCKIHSWNTNWVHLQPNIRNPHLTEAEHNRFNKKHPPQRQSRKQDGSLYRGAAESLRSFCVSPRKALLIVMRSRKRSIISIEIKLWWGTPSLNLVLSERMGKKKIFLAFWIDPLQHRELARGVMKLRTAFFPASQAVLALGDKRHVFTHVRNTFSSILYCAYT